MLYWDEDILQFSALDIAAGCFVHTRNFIRKQVCPQTSEGSIQIGIQIRQRKMSHFSNEPVYSLRASLAPVSECGFNPWLYNITTISFIQGQRKAQSGKTLTATDSRPYMPQIMNAEVLQLLLYGYQNSKGDVILGNLIHRYILGENGSRKKKNTSIKFLGLSNIVPFQKVTLLGFYINKKKNKKLKDYKRTMQLYRKSFFRCIGITSLTSIKT